MGTRLIDGDPRLRNLQAQNLLNQDQRVGDSNELEAYDRLLQEQTIDYDPANWKEQGKPNGLIPFHDENEPGANFFAFDAQSAADALVAFEKYALALKTSMMLLLAQVQMLDKATSGLDDDALPIDNTVYAQSDLEWLQSHLSLAQKRLPNDKLGPALALP